MSDWNTGFDDFGGMGGYENTVNEVRRGGDSLFEADLPGDTHQEYNTQSWNFNVNQPQPQVRYRPANIIVPDSRVNQPGAEGTEYETEEVGANVFTRAVDKLREKGGLSEEQKETAGLRRALRTAEKARNKARRETRKARRTFFRTRAQRRKKLTLDDQATDAEKEKEDYNAAGVVWKMRTRSLPSWKDGWIDSGYGWVLPAIPAGGPISTITFNMAGVLPSDKPFMDRVAYYRVNHTLMELSDQEMEQEKRDAMRFFDKHFGLSFKSAGKPIKGEEDDGSLQIPGLATLRRYAISPSLKTRITTAVSADHPIEADEKVHETGWIATVIAKRGANLGGIFGGDAGKAVKPGTSMAYGNWVFINPNFQNDHAIIHFESSEPSFFGGASGHVTHHYRIHDLSVIDGIHIKQGAFGTAISTTTERKILGNKKKLGDLYDQTEAHVQTTINITHF